MKNEPNRIDDLFKQKLEGYQAAPSRSVWKSIVHNFLKPHLGKLSLLNFQNLIIGVAVIGSAVTVYSLWPSSTGEPSSAESLSAEITALQPEQPTIQLSDERIVQPKDQSSAETTPSDIITGDEGNDPHTMPERPIGLAKGNQQEPNGKTVPEEEIFIAEPSLTLNRVENMTAPSAAGSGKSYRAVQSYGLTEMPVRVVTLHAVKAIQVNHGKHERLEYKNSSFGYPVARKADYHEPLRVSTGIYFMPEWTDYQNDAGYFNNSYTQEILATLHYKDIFLQPGIGISRMQDDGNYQIDYNKFEMVGYFFGVSSFTGVTGYPDSVVFETYVNEVYDSVFHTDAYHTDNAYTYLHIPFHIGYRFMNHKRFSAYVVAGPTYHHLLKEKEHQPAFTESQANLLNMENQTLVRSKNTWQFLLGLGAQYRITETFSFTLEPIYQQYLKSPYNDSGSSRLPYSFGFRAGLMVDF